MTATHPARKAEAQGPQLPVLAELYRTRTRAAGGRMIPAEGSRRPAGRDADGRSCQRQQVTGRGQAPAPPASPVRPVRLQFTRGPVPDTPAAACASHDPDLWFSDSPHDIAQATAICHRCPERAPCLSGALRRRETYGIWAGTDVTAGRQKTDVA